MTVFSLYPFPPTDHTPSPLASPLSALPFPSPPVHSTIPTLRLLLLSLMTTDPSLTLPPTSDTTPTEPLYGLLLVGGQSSRMGQAKALLTLSGRPLYLHLLSSLLHFCPHVYVALPPLHPLTTLLPSPPLPPRCEWLFDAVERWGDIGPALPLLTAHSLHPTASFLVLATDFPFIAHPALTQLLEEDSRGGGTRPCQLFYHPSDGAPEPLCGVWRPAALRVLEERVQRGRTGPCEAVREVLGMRRRTGRKKGKKGPAPTVGEEGGLTEAPSDASEAVEEAEGVVGLVKPKDPLWLFNCNTREEWEEAKTIEKGRRGWAGGLEGEGR